MNIETIDSILMSENKSHYVGRTTVLVNEALDLAASGKEVAVVLSSTDHADQAYRLATKLAPEDALLTKTTLTITVGVGSVKFRSLSSGGLRGFEGVALFDQDMVFELARQLKRIKSEIRKLAA